MGGVFCLGLHDQHAPTQSRGLAQQFLLGMVSRNGATALKSFKASVASVLSNMFLIGGSVALSIHIVLTFFRMHGLLLTLAFVTVWLVSVTGYLQWIQQTSKQPTKRKTSIPQGTTKPTAASWRERQSA